MLVLDEADEMLNKGTSHRSRISPDLELLTRSQGRGETWNECKRSWCLREASCPRGGHGSEPALCSYWGQVGGVGGGCEASGSQDRGTSAQPSMALPRASGGRHRWGGVC